MYIYLMDHMKATQQCRYQGFQSQSFDLIQTDVL